MNLVERLRIVQKRIENAALKANRDPKEVKLIPVSKYHPIEAIQTLAEIGIKDFAENKVQELIEKQSTLSSKINWHFIGHLQRNKVKYLIRMPNIRLIHSVDSLRLAEEIQKRCEIEDREMNILIQLNVADDQAKFGVSDNQLFELIQQISCFERVKIKGLMTILPEIDPNKTRPYFRKLKELALEIENMGLAGVEMAELSMGMTNDFEIAIEEGATLIRIGSAIFGARNY